MKRTIVKIIRFFFILPVILGFVVKSMYGRGIKGIILLLIAYALIAGVVLPELSYSVDFLTFTGVHWLNTYFFVGVIYVLVFEWRNKKVDDSEDLGKSVWSTKKDLEKAGLVGNGIVFGKIEGKLIEKPSTKDGHVLLVGGSGTGKSSANAIPTLLRWDGTGLTVDIKGELSEKTAHLYPNSIIFSTEKRLARYNPLDFIREIEDVQEIGRLMFPKPQKGDPYWSQMAQAIFSAACWEYRHSMSFSEVAQFLCSKPDKEIIETLLNSHQMETRILANTVNNLKPETLGTIFSELRGKLMTFAVDKNIQYATSQSDFSPEDIENNMIYLQVSEKRLKQYGQLFGIIVSQFLRYLMGREEHKKPPVLIMLDEFPRLGEMSEIVEGLATLRSRNVHLVLMIQSLAQLDDIYGKDKRRVIVDNCAYKLVLLATDPETQKYFSDMAGQKTARITGYTQKEGIREEQTFNVSQQTVPLIRPEEFGVLKKPILFAFRLRPVEIEQTFWFKEPKMKTLVENR